MQFTTANDAAEVLQRWGTQTIAFAFSVRDAESGENQFDHDAPARSAMIEAETKAQSLWEEARKQSGGDSAKLSAIQYPFARAVIEWCHKHINRSTRTVPNPSHPRQH